jgi:serine/threonine-protein kinase HipA
MAFAPDGQRESRVTLLMDAASTYHLDRVEAADIIDRQADVIESDWDEVCDAAQLTVLQRRTFMGNQFLNPHVFE